MIEKLNWDSECFGYVVGKLVVDNLRSFNIEELPALAKGYSLVYIFSREEITVKYKNLLAVDRKVLLKRLAIHLPDDFKRIRPYHGVVNKHLLNLALQSGEFSRFRTDRAFRNNEYLKLYSEWIIKSVDRTIADDIFVFSEVNRIQGFITLKKKDTVADIGLVAVDPSYRGRGIGSKLVRYVVDRAYKLGCLEIKVVTQFENKAAMALYENNGFILSDLSYVYHFRNE